MDAIPLSALLAALVLLLILSAFFSGSETSMMAVNRYRLRHRAQSGQRGARLAERLLAQTDRLLSVILLGNNLVNAAAAALVTVIAFRLFGENELALSLATVSVTFLILVFSEVTPKVLGASYAERIVPLVSYPLTLLLKLAGPVIWFINLFVRAMIRLLRLQPRQELAAEPMGVEELRTVLIESGRYLPLAHRDILLNLFELEKITVDDVMCPRGQIEAIDIELDLDDIRRQIETSHHDRLPVYAGELNEVLGILDVRRALARLLEGPLDHAGLRELLRDPYYIPAGTPLLTQLSHFRDNRQSLGLVVDEYGELLGLITVEDILEEIVGEFAAVTPLPSHPWQPQPDGSYLVEGSARLRELNRKLNLQLPLTGPRTLNGLILEHLEAMPEAGVSVKIAGYPIEIVQVQDRMVRTARIVPRRI
ncbi:MAG: CNNM domain-containing protein [Thiobacillaceae bacterium]|nr:CNNM domain-containing protein [Thiobacillaceae bacterium]MDW8323187.1 CNNM domain-containing protein [Burkholderiales bacterium]